MQLNLENFTFDEEWLQSVARLEEDSGNVGAGIDGLALGALLENPSDYNSIVASQMLVLRVWQAWVSEWSLGIGTGSAQQVGRGLLLTRLKTVSPSIQSQILSIVEEQRIHSQNEKELTESTQQKIRQIIENVLKPEDWRKISFSACERIEQQVMTRQPMSA